MLLIRLRRRLGIAQRLYFVIGLTLCAIVGLAAVSIHFAFHTESLAANVEKNSLSSARLTADLLAMLERHRRLVQTALGAVGRENLPALRLQLESLETEITTLNQRLDEGLAVAGLFGSARSVLFALELGDGAFARTILDHGYTLYAERMASEVVARRIRSAAQLDSKLASLLRSARVTIGWLLTCVAAALQAGIVVVLVVGRVVHRLRGMTRAMLRLAAGETEVTVPSLGDADEVGELARAAEVFQATSREMRRRGEALARTGLQLETALANMSQGLCMYDGEGRLVLANARYFEIFGFDREVIRPGTRYREVLAHSFAAGNYPGRSLEEVIAAREAFVAMRVRDTRLLRLASSGRVARIMHEPMPDGGWILTFEDVTERRRAEERIVFMARHDPLTGLANRAQFQEKLEQAVQQAARGSCFALLCLDLDGFKAVNDTLGHPAGDRLLQAVAARLMQLVREIDTVARLGGDEFAIVQLGATEAKEAAALAERILAAIAQPFDIDGQSVMVGTSIGVALAPADGADVETLMRNADLALYRSKAEGRRMWRFFEPGMNARAQSRRSMELDLRLALAREQLAVHYQPTIDAATRRICGFEALLRWTHPTLGAIPPHTFVPVAEEVGLIVPIGAWVLRQACTEAARWPEEIRVSVNLSPAQFRSPYLVRTVTEALAEAGLRPDRLELEITEALLLKDSEATVATLHRLRDAGVRIALDDFGTGHASLGSVRSFPFDRIKIDQSFVRDLATRAEAAAIVRAVTGLAADLGIATTAEGVETVEQMQRLMGEGCTELQGRLFSQPRPASGIAPLLEATELWLRGVEAPAYAD